MKSLLLKLFFLLLIPSATFSQNSSHAYHTLADSLYRNYNYQFAADYYEKALKKSASPGEIMLQLAKCYNRINLLPDALKWFLQAESNQTPFSPEDSFEYAQVLISMKNNKKADAVLEQVLQKDPNAHHLRKVLDDLRNVEKYYRDSTSMSIISLPINRATSEFAPAFYKEGIVFSSARQESYFSKTFQWDNSHFLNLYFTSMTSSHTFSDPRFFEEGLNTKQHDGPVTFYSKHQRMIVSRNQKLKIEGREDVYEWRQGLYDGQYNAAKSEWEVTALPFNDATHSYSHPSISEDGNVLYFISDQPGGYGGTDIYRVTRTNKTWGIPFNLGPAINTPGNETFPFATEHTLYFASEGHGGLGGLDIFVSTQTINGFTPPSNLGYPINSTGDDFSLITDDQKQTGYFASSRNGNDDLFSFQRVPLMENVFAQIFDRETNARLGGANIEIITASGIDIALKTDSLGGFSFKLPSETPYLIIGSKNNKIGMVAGVAERRSEIQQIPAYGDTTTLVCLVTIKNEKGLLKKASGIIIIDQRTGTRINHPADQSIITFQGEKGHDYLIEIHDDEGRHTSHQLNIGQHDNGIKRLSMILPDTLPALKMAARIFRADNNQPLTHADVKIITFGEKDQELIADDGGVINFDLADGTVYVLIGSKDGFTGMHSGSAEKATVKLAVIHPVPAYGDPITDEVLVMGLITDLNGHPIEGFSTLITNKSTGEHIIAETKKGLITFHGKRGGTYNLSVSHNLYNTSLQKLVIPSAGADAEKFTVVLENNVELKERLNPFVTVADYHSISSRIPTAGSLLFVDSEDGSTRAFIASSESLAEITEENNFLYLTNSSGKQNLGSGTLSKLKADPASVLKGQIRPVNLRNIYFDFDKDNLSDDGIAQLRFVKKILAYDEAIRLTVAGHADDRGRFNYNQKLSERRARAVAGHLVAHGIDEKRITEKGFGESLPSFSCQTGNCSEEEHQLNRRAEFVIRNNGKDDFERKETLSASRVVGNQNKTTYQKLLEKSSEEQVEGITFKITVGAYKKQPGLLFSALSDLGRIESVVDKGITYYYLSNFTTLKKAEEIRHEVIRRGIKDASISVFQNGGKITLKTYAGLFN